MRRAEQKAPLRPDPPGVAPSQRHASPVEKFQDLDRDLAPIVQPVPECRGRNLPVGRFHIRGQLYWAWQFSSFGDEWYEVARMAPAEMSFVVESNGGGTRGCAQPGIAGL